MKILSEHKNASGFTFWLTNGHGDDDGLLRLLVAMDYKDAVSYVVLQGPDDEDEIERQTGHAIIYGDMDKDAVTDVYNDAVRRSKPKVVNSVDDYVGGGK